LKILVVHEVSFPKKVVYEIHEFPELLALLGHEVTFVDFDEGARFGSNLKVRDRPVAGRIHQDAKIRLITPHAFGLSALDRVWAIFSSIPVFWKQISRGNYDVVLNFAVPTYGLQVNWVARIFGVPVVHRALDVSHKIQKTAWNPLIRIFEKWVLQLSTLISANNPAMKSYVERELPSAVADKVQVHYPPLDLEVIRATPFDQELAKSLGIVRGDKVVMYMGSFFYFSGLDEFIRNLKSSMDANPRLKFLLIGGGEQDSYLRGLVNDLDLNKSVVFAGFVPFQELGKYMSLADLAINPLLPDEVASVAFPQKVLQYLAVGLPVVSTKLDGLIAAFGTSQPISWVAGPADGAAEVARLFASPSLPIVTAQQRKKLVEMFSPSTTVKALEEFLQQAIKTIRSEEK
jgi:glycosyltransferase involved in cell wall biosynthesis